MPYQFSDAILQTLDREVGGFYLTSGPYEETIAKWKGIPIIYAKEHPDPKLFAKDPEKALAKVKGKIVGEIISAWMEKTGHPRAMAQFGISDEYPEVLKLKQDGKLSHSTSFFARLEGKKLSGEVAPNHVLIFEETNKDLPKDAGAFILNKLEAIPQIQSKEVNMGCGGYASFDDCVSGMMEKEGYDEETAKKVCGKIKAEAEMKEKAEMKGDEAPIRPSTEDVKMPDEVKMKEEQVAILNKQIADKDKILAEKSAEITILQQKVEKYEKDIAEAEWVQMKTDLPVGMLHKPEDETVLREEWEKDTKKFARRILAMKKPDLPKKEGQVVIDESAEFKTINTDWKSRGGF